MDLEPSARAGLYGFFSRLFVREVDDAFWSVLTGDIGHALLPSFSESPEARLPAAERSVFDADFTHITVVNVVPYESFYRREDGMIESGSQSAVAVFYRKYGFEADLAAGRALSPDHIGIELELLSALCEQEASALAADRPAYASQIRGVQRAFLGEHLLSWAPVYLMAVQRNARTALYRDGAEAALELMMTDHESLSRRPEALLRAVTSS